MEPPFSRGGMPCCGGCACAAAYSWTDCVWQNYRATARCHLLWCKRLHPPAGCSLLHNKRGHPAGRCHLVRHKRQHPAGGCRILWCKTLHPGGKATSGGRMQPFTPQKATTRRRSLILTQAVRPRMSGGARAPPTAGHASSRNGKFQTSKAQKSA